MKDPDAFKMKTWEERGGEYMRRLIRDLDLKDFQAAGFIGNPGYESRGFTALQEEKPLIAGSKGGGGIAQWTGPRRLDFEDYARQRGLTINSDAANYGFLVHELRGKQKKFLEQLRRTETLDQAASVTHVLYERPLDVIRKTYTSAPDRVEWAERAMNGFKRANGEAPAEPIEDDAEETEAPDTDEVFRPFVEAGIVALKAGTRMLQLGLRETGDYNGKIDGVMGPKTRAGIKAFQRRAKNASS